MSVGICQVKMSTAKKLEEAGYIKSVTAQDGGWTIFGFKIHGTEKMARAKKLSDTATNCMYAAAYIRYMQELWGSVYSDIATDVGILATLYNIGKENVHSDPKTNPFGDFAKEHYDYVKTYGLGIGENWYEENQNNSPCDPCFYNSFLDNSTATLRDIDITI